MKCFLVLLLGAVLCLDSGSSLQCYSCKSKLSNNDCQKEVTCTDKEMCKTDVIRLIGLFNIINKGCDASCASDYQDFSVGTRNISCCSSDLCNLNAGSGVRSGSGVAAGIAGSMFWIILTNRL